MPLDNTIAIQETFINDAKNHTTHYKESRKRNGGIFFENYLKGMIGLLITEKRVFLLIMYHI